MKYFIIAICSLIAILNVTYFEQIELWLIQHGLSWTFSKIFPYLTLLVFGFLIGFSLMKSIPARLKSFKILLVLVVGILPFCINFALHPIYEGDFALQGKEVLKKEHLSDFENADLVVITIPDCPFCHGSIGTLQLLKARNPQMRIKFVVCSSDPKTLDQYKTHAGKGIDVVNAQQLIPLSEVAETGFPTFVLVKNNIPVLKWGNDQFGVRAKDKMESHIGNP